MRVSLRRSIVTTTLVAAAIVWAVTIGAMVRAIRRFEATPGRQAVALPSWPAASRIPRAPGEWRLVMLVHPQCSCSRASIEELRRIIEKSPASLQTYVVVYRPSDFPAGWERTDVFTAAAKLPRTHIVLDPDGHEANVFQGFVSGQTFLYDGDGRLRFSGGITLLRGEAGFNGGSAGVMQIVRTGKGNGEHPVFGCAIRH
jgi:hypothetical protein